ncbi:unannotated protein [freshwater metagenome]|uniref:Unannotated protein n=1 Tax=freshwater metagenome TaxID=449393 RepID=A0A6J6MZ11_9ZZZZ
MGRVLRKVGGVIFFATQQKSPINPRNLILSGLFLLGGWQLRG